MSAIQIALVVLILSIIGIAWYTLTKEINRHQSSPADIYVGVKTTSMPKWQCHKIVSAFKIESAFSDYHNGCILTGNGYTAAVTNDWALKNEPKTPHHLGDIKEFIGGYFVRYEDGYESFSPAEAFESGYTLMTDSAIAIKEYFETKERIRLQRSLNDFVTQKKVDALVDAIERNNEGFLKVIKQKKGSSI